MAANLAITNFAVGGTLTVSGNVTLSSHVSSINSANFFGLTTTTLEVSAGSTFNGALPTSTQTPSRDIDFTTKVYVDSQISNTDYLRKNYVDAAHIILKNLISSTDATRKTYVDDADTVLKNLISSTDATRKTYVDNADNALSALITSTDATRKTYVDNADKALSALITSTDATQKTYIDDGDATLSALITNTDNSRKTYIDTLLNSTGRTLQTKYLSSQNSYLIGTPAAQGGYITYNPSQISPITQNPDGSRTYDFAFLPIFMNTITSKSANSTIFLTFGCEYQAVGQNGVAVIGSTILVNNTKYGFITAQNVNVGAFPIQAVYKNNKLNDPIKIIVAIGTADIVDPYTILINSLYWSFTFTEVQN